jgi:hypothetical protein
MLPSRSARLDGPWAGLGVIRSKLRPRATETRSVGGCDHTLSVSLVLGIPELNLQNNGSAKCQGNVGLILATSCRSKNIKEQELEYIEKQILYSVSLVFDGICG